MIRRALLNETLQTAKEFKIVCVTGPRQSGKTTLCKQVFPKLPYISLEDPDVAEEAAKDGRKFLLQFKQGAVLDEVQRVPALFNYLQRIVDEKNKNGQFVLTGSSNFLMQNNISQSLAGRVGYIELLPFSLNELSTSREKLISVEQLILHGMYPAVVTNKTSYHRWAANYIKTYIERDVRLLRNIENIAAFQKFVKLCASRAAQLTNASQLANETGVDVKTIQAWLSVLESSYIIHFLQPYHQNFNKRIVKSPKMYFYDTGLLCYLLGISSISSLKRSNHYGHLFENFIVTEIRKNRFNKEQNGNIHFFRDSTGNEVDLIIEKEEKLLPIEVKSGIKTDRSSYKNIIWWQKVFRETGGILITGGNENKNAENNISIVGWKNVSDI